MITQASLLQHLRTGYKDFWDAIPSWSKKLALFFPLPAGTVMSLATSNYSWEQAKIDAQTSYDSLGDDRNPWYSPTVGTSNQYITGRLNNTIPDALTIAEIETAVVAAAAVLTGIGLFGSYCVAKYRARNNRTDLNIELMSQGEPDVELASQGQSVVRPAIFS